MPLAATDRVNHVLVVAAGLLCCLAINDDQDIMNLPFVNSLPYGDREFYHNYMTFVTTVAPNVFYAIMAVCIVLGIIGNVCFLYFFANPKSRVFRTKDALFFRRMSIVDFLTCALILPYAIVFEARILEYDTVCKITEFLRHFMVYTSHLMLIFYSLEFTTKDHYYVARHRFNRNTVLIIIASLVLAFPTLVIFEAGNPNSFSDLMEQNVSLVEPILQYPIPASVSDVQPLPSGFKSDDRMRYFNPRFCHLSLNYDEKADNFSSVKTLITWYSMMNGVAFFVSCFTLVAQVIKLMESNPFVGRNSVFVQVVELNHPELTTKLRKLEMAQMQRKQQRRETRRNLRMSRSSVSAPPKSDVSEPGDMEDKQSNINSVEHVRIFGHSVDATIGQSKTNNTKPDPELEGDLQQGASRAIPNRRILAVRSTLDKAGEVHTDMTSSIMSPVTHPEVPSPNEVSWSRSQAAGISLFLFIFSCQIFRSRRKSIRMLGSADHSPRTYKYSIMYLIIIDLLVLCGAVLCFVISEERSYVMNLVHFKSVFGFYIVSFIHDELYDATWDGGSSCCRHHHRNQGSVGNNI